MVSKEERIFRLCDYVFEKEEENFKIFVRESETISDNDKKKIIEFIESDELQPSIAVFHLLRQMNHMYALAIITGLNID